MLNVKRKAAGPFSRYRTFVFISISYQSMDPHTHRKNDSFVVIFSKLYILQMFATVCFVINVILIGFKCVNFLCFLTLKVVDDISGSVTINVPEKNVSTIQFEKPEEESDDELEIHGKRR